MNENETSSDRLLASIAVFAELCDSKTDIQSIIIEFIRSLFTLENTFSLSVGEAVDGLKRHFEFELIEAVVKSCLNRMKRDGMVSLSNKRYTLIDPSANSPELSRMLSEKKDSRKHIELALVEYAETLLHRTLTEAERGTLIKHFLSGILDGRQSTDEFGTIVSTFIVENSVDSEFVSSLNEIREGIVILTGLKYQQDLRDLGHWNSPLTIYLETEILFHAAGYNGEIYKRLFDDFYSLVRDINTSPGNRSGKDLIQLMYFESTKGEVDRFFRSAESIICREQNASPESGAMEEILKGCKHVSDVVRKRSDFDARLMTYRITLQQDLDYYSCPEFNVEDKTLLEKYNGVFDDGSVADILKSFTKVKFLRRGRNNTMFEKCGHIILSGKSIAFQLARDLEVKDSATDIPFVTDLIFITNRLWFRLNKGFSQSDGYPFSLDVVVNARISISALINRSVRLKFERLRDDVKAGRLSKENAQQYHHYLREKAKLPEEITTASLKESVDFLYDEAGFQAFVDNSLLLKTQSAELVSARSELKQLHRERRHDSRRQLKKDVRELGNFVTVVCCFIGALILVSFFIVVWLLVSQTDSTIAILSFLLALIPFGWAAYKWVAPLTLMGIRRACFRRYREKLMKLNR